MRLKMGKVKRSKQKYFDEKELKYEYKKHLKLLIAIDLKFLILFVDHFDNF